MSFVFRFKQLLQICIHEENEVKNRLAQKDGQIAEIKASIRKLKEEHAQALKNKTEDLKNGNMIQIQMYPAYLKRLQNTWEYHEEEIERLEKQRAQILEELIEKRKNKKTYEKMKEKDELAWKKEQHKKEQKRLDEFGNRMKKGVFEDA